MRRTAWSGPMRVAVLVLACLPALAGCLEARPPLTAQPPCAEPPEGPAPTAPPPCIVAHADAFIQGRVGALFAERFITFDAARSRYDGPPLEDCRRVPTACTEFPSLPHYALTYALRVPERPFINESVALKVALNGTVLRPDDVGLPDCRAHRRECAFPIDETRAIRIARGAGLEEGRGPWATSFHWYAGDVRSFVWTVSVTLDERGSEASGRTAVIDANDGRLIGISRWVSFAH